MAVSANEFRERMSRLQQSVAAEGLDLFIVSSEESIYYLTGISYKPLERPFIILVRPGGEPEMLVPVMERDHLAGAFSVRLMQTYWDYPSPPGEGWEDRLLELTGESPAIGVEPSLPLEIFQVLGGLRPAMLPLVERQKEKFRRNSMLAA